MSTVEDLEKVVSARNCTGCGMCAALIPGISMRLEDNGFLRPHFSDSAEEPPPDSPRLEQFCPGIRVLRQKAPEATRRHPIFGAYVMVWESWAADPDVRFAGSSGGVLTALAAELARRYPDRGGVLGAAASVQNPRRTIPVRITTREEALASAGSRYAPVSTLSGVGGTVGRDTLAGAVLKPCEAVALRASATIPTALILSFFCAGTPSQKATEDIIEGLNIDPNGVTSLRYRGNGWPGDFHVDTVDGASSSLSYGESWGNTLGKQLQHRCKICVDGTGENADVSVGDYWKTNEKGFPLFDNESGRSVVIARTSAGLDFIQSCIDRGILVARELELDKVSGIQPLQVHRRQTLAGRLIGQKFAGRKPPRYVGYELFRHVLRHPLLNFRAALGSFIRVYRSK